MSDQQAPTPPGLQRFRNSLSLLLQRSRVTTGPSVRPFTVSITAPSDRQELEQLQGELTALPAGEAKVTDWLALADGFAAAGLFGQARDTLDRATQVARAENTPTAEAEAQFKFFRAACELGDFAAALAAYRAAVTLCPHEYDLFDAGRFEVVSILGAGGFGTVFHCRDLLAGNRDVAIKALHADGLSRSLEDVFAEARTLKSLQQPGQNLALIGIDHWGFVDTRQRRGPYFVLEYFPGVSLAEHVRQHGTLGVPDLVAIARPVARTMQAAHAAGVLHRDLKPSNLLVRQTPAGWEVRVIDFGLAVALSSARTGLSVPSNQRSIRDQAFAGTLRYAPPEQRGDRTDPVREYSDVYSFGKTFIEALLGDVEAVDEDWERVPAEVRDTLKRLLQRCVVPAPGRRFPNFDPIVQELETLGPRSQAAREEQLTANLKRWETSPEPRAWVDARGGQWNHADWLQLLSALRASSYWPLREEDVGRVVEAARVAHAADLRRLAAEAEAERQRQEAERERQRQEAEQQRAAQAEAQRQREQAERKQREAEQQRAAEEAQRRRQAAEAERQREEREAEKQRRLAEKQRREEDEREREAEVAHLRAQLLGDPYNATLRQEYIAARTPRFVAQDRGWFRLGELFRCAGQDALARLVGASTGGYFGGLVAGVAVAIGLLVLAFNPRQTAATQDWIIFWIGLGALAVIILGALAVVAGHTEEEAAEVRGEFNRWVIEGISKMWEELQSKMRGAGETSALMGLGGVALVFFFGPVVLIVMLVAGAVMVAACAGIAGVVGMVIGTVLAVVICCALGGLAGFLLGGLAGIVGGLMFGAVRGCVRAFVLRGLGAELGPLPEEVVRDFSDARQRLLSGAGGRSSWR